MDDKIDNINNTAISEEFESKDNINYDSKKATRRDFILFTTGAVAGVGILGAVWPFIDSMNPAADVLANASIEVDLSAVKEGQSITVKWRGKPVFIRNRTADEVQKARVVDLKELRDPQTDDQRVKLGYENWLVMIGVCTHLGCIPIGESGDYGGWFCPCHGSQYDTSGRIRKGPAPLNLAIPDYNFINNTQIKIG